MEDFHRLSGLRLRLWVNGELRQDGTAADMITWPAAALTLLARFQLLDPGDLVLTGTPAVPPCRRRRRSWRSWGPAADAAQVAGLLLPPGTQSRLSQGGRRDHRVDRDP
jgi:2-keto-4-pentenoate hydratase/2-oxohepta-3-ene-1,7-dioic acid hydratase in catechol pathway